jgi:RHS repeat-associated protein
LTELQDSQAGTFTATYDADGQIVTEDFPNALQAQTTYDETGSPVELRYQKTNGVCGASCTWLSFKVFESIHGQWMSQDGTLSDQEYSYDRAGRLTFAKDTRSGLACTSRAYTYDDASNRRSRIARGPGGGCAPGDAGNTTTYDYDDADRLTGTGVDYDTFGRITRLAGYYAGGAQLTSSYYVNDLVQSQDQDGIKNEYTLDPARRQRTIKTTDQRTNPPVTKTEVFHYADDSDSPSWFEKGATYSRNIEGIGGDLIAIRTENGTVELQLSNLHGDVVATASLDSSAPGPLRTFEADEFGNPKPNQAVHPRYGWLGEKQRRTELGSGIVQMGVRSYVPDLGRFLQVDPIEGGSANRYDYAFQDPVNQIDLDGLKRKKRNAHQSRACVGCGTGGRGGRSGTGRRGGSGGGGRKSEGRRNSRVTKGLKPWPKKTLRPEIQKFGGRSGKRVKNMTGPRHSVFAGSSNPHRIYVTNGRGNVVADIIYRRTKIVIPGQGFATGPYRPPTAQEKNWLDAIWGH